MGIVALAGCAKQPAMTAASAPSPSGPGQTATPPGTPETRAQDQARAQGAGAGAGAGAAGPAGGAAAGAGAGAAAAAPTTPRPPAREFAPTPHLKDVHFDFDKYEIRPGDAKILDANATWLKSNEGLILIEGHCDERGTNEYNLVLGERRAKATMNYLVSQGVQAGRITILSYGEERPLCTERVEECWAKNRRAHFLSKPR
jgi:peptidoglycan-associated lipoprotein